MHLDHKKKVADTCRRLFSFYLSDPVKPRPSNGLPFADRAFRRAKRVLSAAGTAEATDLPPLQRAKTTALPADRLFPPIIVRPQPSVGKALPAETALRPHSFSVLPTTRGYTTAHTGEKHRELARAAGAKYPWRVLPGRRRHGRAALGRRGIPPNRRGCGRRAVPFFSVPVTPRLPGRKGESLSFADRCHFLKGVFGAFKAGSPSGKPAFFPVFSPRFQGHKAAPLFPKYPILRLLFSTDIDIINKIDADPRSWRTRCTNE